MDLLLNSNSWGSMFGVPTAVVDQYLKLATPSQLKVLLYLLRNQCTAIDTASISKALAINEELVEEAVMFWEQTDLFTSSGNRESDATSEAAVRTEAPPKEEQPQTIAVVQRSSSEVTLTPSEIAGELRRSDGLMDLFRMAEQLTGEPLTHMQQRSLLWLYQYLSVPSDIILTVMSYCRSINKPSINYAEKMLFNWWNNGICTLQQINEEILKDQEHRSYYGFMVRTLDMKRPPTTKQKEFFDRWKALGLTDELMRYAYEKTYEQTGKLSLEYMESIVVSWSKSGYKTREDVDTYDKLTQNSDELKSRSSSRNKKKKEIPESPMADAYRSLVYNIDE